MQANKDGFLLRDRSRHGPVHLRPALRESHLGEGTGRAHRPAVRQSRGALRHRDHSDFSRPGRRAQLVADVVQSDARVWSTSRTTTDQQFRSSPSITNFSTKPGQSNIGVVRGRSAGRRRGLRAASGRQRCLLRPPSARSRPTGSAAAACWSRGTRRRRSSAGGRRAAARSAEAP